MKSTQTESVNNGEVGAPAGYHEVSASENW